MNRVPIAEAASWSPDGRHVVSASQDRRLRVWEIPSGRLAASWTCQAQGACYVSYTPDGFRFAVPGTDMSALGVSQPKLEVWDAQRGRALLNLEAHRETISGATFDAAGRKLVTSSMDGTVRQWEAFPWREADYPEPRGAALPERVRHYARNYWRERIAETHPSTKPDTPSVDAPMPPGIPEWERDRWPPRDPAAGPEQINLDSAYTSVLDAVFFPTGNEVEWDDDLADLPMGYQRFGEVWFDVRGVVWLNSDPLTVSYYPDFPQKVEGIAVGRKFRKLHVLHAATKLFAMTPDMGKDPNGNPLPIGAYILRYADGTQHEFQLQYGRDLRLWWWGGRGDSEAQAERSRVVWVGTNATSQRYEAKLRLFQSTFENPRPEVEVVAVDFISKKTLFAPFLVAMTVDPSPALPHE